MTSLCHILSCISVRPCVSELYTFKKVNKKLSAITLQMDSNEAVCKGKLCFQQEIKPDILNSKQSCSFKINEGQSY